MELTANVTTLLKTNCDLSQRMIHLKATFDMQTLRDCQTTESVMIEIGSQEEDCITTREYLNETIKTSTSVTPGHLDLNALDIKSLALPATETDDPASDHRS